MTRHGLLWLITIIAIFLFAPLVVSQAEYKACIDSEITAASEWYGNDELGEILDRTKGIYHLLMVKTGIDTGLRKHFVKPIPSEVAPGVEMPKYLAGYADHLMGYWGSLLYNIWLFCFRLAHSWTWIVFLAPFLVATIFDGVMTRKAKLSSFRYTSPTVYNLSWHLIIAMAAISLVAFAVSIPLSVLSYPLVLTGMGLLIRLVISNIQHSA
ncbi:MAG: DUF4400 domain-containing protein [Sulfuricella sp.]|jgi:hypothetical protein|nr:DUF4400 domain-containing protein [Sulfuricella sp.]